MYGPLKRKSEKVIDHYFAMIVLFYLFLGIGQNIGFFGNTHMLHV